MEDRVGSKGKYITPTEAARILGCKPRKVHDLCDQGLVRRLNEGDDVFVRSEDIAEIHRLNIAGEMQPGEMIRRILFLETKVRRLEETLNLVLEVNGMAASRFIKMEDIDLHRLYQEVERALGEEEWSVEEMVRLCEIFVKITEVEVDRLNELLNTDHSWQPLYRLCLHMTRYVATQPDLTTNLDLQRVRDLLHAGRKNLSTIAVLFVEKAGQIGPSRKLLAKLAASDLELFDAMAKQLKGSSGRGKLQLA